THARTHAHDGLGLKGGYVGTCLLALATVWSILSGLGMWKSDLSLDFPVNVNDALSHAQLITSLKGTRPRARCCGPTKLIIPMCYFPLHAHRIGLCHVHERDHAALAVQVHLLPPVPPGHALPLQAPVRHQVPLSVPHAPPPSLS